MYRFQKHFTLEEARALLPALRQLFHDAHQRRQRMQQLEAKLSRRQEKHGGDLGGPDVAALVTELTHLNDGIRQLNEWGIEVKDFERGLVDFPHLREGREVFLCWELDEEDIEFWHDIEAGYAGRERL
jgi:hypothetical protein